jgi:hypothetical protein
MFRTGSTGQVCIAIEVANPEEKNAYHLVPTLGLPTEYYPFIRRQVPVGHSVHTLAMSVICIYTGCVGNIFTHWLCEQIMYTGCVSKI